MAILQLPTHGCINVHASLLPRWRGAAPIERAVMAGDTETGVGIMQMETGLDTGPVYREAKLPILINSDSRLLQLEAELAQLGAGELLCVLDELQQAPLPKPKRQSEIGITYAHKLTSEDREIDWSASASTIHRQIWALRDRMAVRAQVAGTTMQLLQAEVIEQLDNSPHNQAGCIVDATKHGILIQCATDLLRITKLKLEKGKGTELTAAQAINGFQQVFTPGHRFARTDA